MPNDSVEAVRSYYRTILPFYEDENQHRADLASWRRLVTERKPQRILELGAGTGRVTAALRELAPVVGIDLSPEMLRCATDRLQRQINNVAFVRHLFPAELVLADMRRLALGRRFDLIVAPNDPFSHVTRTRERQSALRAVAQHLEPGGLLVIEGLYRAERRRIEVPERLVNGISVREVWEPLAGHDCWRAHYSYRRGAEQTDAEFVARAWNPLEVSGLLEGCGLNLRAMWGDFDRRPFTRKAERIILVADRRSPES